MTVVGFPALVVAQPVPKIPDRERLGTSTEGPVGIGRQLRQPVAPRLSGLGLFGRAPLLMLLVLSRPLGHPAIVGLRCRAGRQCSGHVRAVRNSPAQRLQLRGLTPALVPK